MTGREEITFVQMIIAKEFNVHKKKIRDVLNRVCMNSEHILLTIRVILWNFYFQNTDYISKRWQLYYDI